MKTLGNAFAESAPSGRQPYHTSEEAFGAINALVNDLSRPAWQRRRRMKAFEMARDMPSEVRGHAVAAGCRGKAASDRPATPACAVKGTEPGNAARRISTAALRGAV